MPLGERHQAARGAIGARGAPKSFWSPDRGLAETDQLHRTVGDATVETTPETGYAAADGEQFTIEAAAECASVCDPVCDAYDCDVRATVAATAAYGAVLACAVYGDWALSCASLSGPAQSVEGGGGDDDTSGGYDTSGDTSGGDDTSGAATAAPSLLLLGWVLAYS